MTATKVWETDVLFLGGGFAGTWGAIRAAELGARVILVEKAHVSRSGASTMSSGVTNGPTRGEDLEAWVEELVRCGHYMVDERWTRKLLAGQIERVEQLDRWGVVFKGDDGNFQRYLSRGMVTVRGVQFSPKAAMEALRARAEELGVQIVDRVSIVELLTSDAKLPTEGRVVGAAGFNTRTGAVHIFRALNTVLATGPMSFKGLNPIDNVTGDGITMALRAGATVADMEFSMSGTFNIVWRNYRVLSLFNIGLGFGLKLINAAGKRFMADHDPERLERSELPVVVAAFVKELLEGRGPVYMDLRDCGEEFWANMVRARGQLNMDILFDPELPDPRKHPIEIEAARAFWSNSRCGPKIDLDCRTSVPGLLAAGAVAKNDACGLHGSAGIPTAFAMNTGYFAGETGARDAADNTDVTSPLDAETITRIEQRVLAPLNREGGTSTVEAQRRLLRLQGSVIENFTLDDASLRKRIAEHEQMAAAFAAVSAQDVHDLVKAHEFASSYHWVGVSLRAMLERTESRASYIRRDYPYTDDFEWRVAHTVRETAEGFVFEKQPFPYEHSTYLPEPPVRYLDPGAALIAEAFSTRPHGSEPVAPDTILSDGERLGDQVCHG